MRTLIRFLLLIPLLTGCGGRLAPAPQTPAVSPRVSLLRAGGLALSDAADTQVTFTVTLDGARYEVVEWRDAGESGVQVAKDGALVADADEAYAVLLSYAWTPEHHGLRGGERDRLRDLHDGVRETRARYDQLFSAAESVGPVLERIDDLKDRPVSGVPTITIGSLTLLEVHNLWDLVCAAPVDIADACLLEPLLREVNEQSAEIERLLALADAALGDFVALLDRQQGGEAVPGRELKEGAEKTLAALQNLERELTEYAALLEQLEGMSSGMAAALRSRNFPRPVTAALNWLRSTAGLDANAALTGTADRLDRLAAGLAGLRTSAATLVAEIADLTTLVTDARLRSEQALAALGSRWQPPDAAGR